MKRKLLGPALVAAVGVAAALVGGGIALAAIPGPNGVIHGCLKNKGQAYLVDPGAGQTCGKDASLDWNEAGARGPKGLPGPQGIPGSQGASGTSGYEIQHAQYSTDGSGNGSGEADCSSGKVVLAGAYGLQGGLEPLHTEPKSDGSGWTVAVTGPGNALFTVYAVCATNGGS
jgi:hypothetical protein